MNDVAKVDFTANMKYILSSSIDCTFRVWDISTTECIRIIRTSSPISSFFACLNGDVVVAGTDSGKLCLIDLQRTQNHVFFRCQMTEPQTKTLNRVRSITVSPDEKTIAIMKKGQLALMKMEEVFKLRQQAKQLEQNNDSEGMKALWQKEFKSLCTHQFESDKLDFISGQHIFNNTVVTFCRNKAS